MLNDVVEEILSNVTKCISIWNFSLDLIKLFKHHIVSSSENKNWSIFFAEIKKTFSKVFHIFKVLLSHRQDYYEYQPPTKLYVKRPMHTSNYPQVILLRIEEGILRFFSVTQSLAVWSFAQLGDILFQKDNQQSHYLLLRYGLCQQLSDVT